MILNPTQRLKSYPGSFGRSQVELIKKNLFFNIVAESWKFESFLDQFDFRVRLALTYLQIVPSFIRSTVLITIMLNIVKVTLPIIRQVWSLLSRPSFLKIFRMSKVSTTVYTTSSFTLYINYMNKELIPTMTLTSYSNSILLVNDICWLRDSVL